MLFRKIAVLLVVLICTTENVFSAPGTAPGLNWDAPESFRRLNPLHTFPFPGYPDTSGQYRFFGGFQLLKDPLKGWLLVGEGSGQVWSLDQNDQWVRQDSTECIGYNGGALVLPGPLKYGGYGIWRSFGLLLFYSWEAHEWHTIELSEEHSRGLGNPVFYHARDSSLYQAGSYSRNDGLKKLFEVTDSVYRLDLRTGDWLTLGRLNPAIPKDYKVAEGGGMIYHTPTGVLFMNGNSRNPLHIDFINRTCRILTDKVSDRLWILSESRYSKDKQVLSTAWGIYSINHKYEVIDSVAWSTLLNQVVQEFPLIEQPKPSYASLALQVLLGLVVLTGSFVAYRRLRRPASMSSSDFHSLQKEQNTTPVYSAPNAEGSFVLLERDGAYLLNGKSLSDMYDQELRLLHVLIEQRKAGESLSTQQFNEILGIEDRTLDNQKKIRSEIIRNFNRHFNACGFPGEAVQRSRQESDRRAVSYVLAPEIVVGQ